MDPDSCTTGTDTLRRWPYLPPCPVSAAPTPGKKPSVCFCIREIIVFVFLWLPLAWCPVGASPEDFLSLMNMILGPPRNWNRLKGKPAKLNRESTLRFYFPCISFLKETEHWHFLVLAIVFARRRVLPTRLVRSLGESKEAGGWNRWVSRARRPCPRRRSGVRVPAAGPVCCWSEPVCVLIRLCSLSFSNTVAHLKIQLFENQTTLFEKQTTSMFPYKKTTDKWDYVPVERKTRFPHTFTGVTVLAPLKKPPETCSFGVVSGVHVFRFILAF